MKTTISLFVLSLLVSSQALANGIGGGGGGGGPKPTGDTHILAGPGGGGGGVGSGLTLHLERFRDLRSGPAGTGGIGSSSSSSRDLLGTWTIRGYERPDVTVLYFRNGEVLHIDDAYEYATLLEHGYSFEDIEGNDVILLDPRKVRAVFTENGYEVVKKELAR